MESIGGFEELVNYGEEGLGVVESEWMRLE